MASRGRKLFFVMLAIIVTLAGIRSIWRAYYNQPLHRIELGLPNASGESYSVEFSLPKGRYIVKAENPGELLSEDAPRIIRYKVELQKQGLVIDQQAKINFSNKVSGVWLEYFEVKDKLVHGTFSVEMVTPSKSAVKGKLFIIKAVLFKTVE